MTDPDVPADEDYNSASDEDFDPDSAPIVKDVSSDEEDGHAPAKLTRRRPAEDLDFDNSGDEAMIKKSKKKRRKADDAEDSDVGEGGLVKTRAQRKAEAPERRAVVNPGHSTVNVDTLWAQMSQAAPASSLNNKEDENTTLDKVEQTSTTTPLTEATVTISRTYEFAGEKRTELRTVPASSAEAKLYLAQQSQKPTNAPTTPVNGGMRRPKKRTSMFDAGGPLASSAGKAKKLTTLEKSKLDWAAHVDTEGMSEELDEARRAKGAYLGRMDFLGRMDAKREEELKSNR